jgi:hypothetical protein
MNTTEREGEKKKKDREEKGEAIAKVFPSLSPLEEEFGQEGKNSGLDKKLGKKKNFRRRQNRISLEQRLLLRGGNLRDRHRFDVIENLDRCVGRTFRIRLREKERERGKIFILPAVSRKNESGQIGLNVGPAA